MAWTTEATDTFIRANTVPPGVSFSGGSYHLVVSALGANWRDYDGGLYIQGNKAQADINGPYFFGTAAAYWATPPSTADQAGQCNFTLNGAAAGTSFAALAMRNAGSDIYDGAGPELNSPFYQGYEIVVGQPISHVGSGNWYLYIRRWNNGTVANSGNPLAEVLLSGFNSSIIHTLRAEVTGSNPVSIVVFLDGVSVLSYNDSDVNRLIAAGYVGIIGGPVSVNTNFTSTDFLGNSGFAFIMQTGSSLSYLAALLQGTGTESLELTMEELPSIIPESLHPKAVDWSALAVELLPAGNFTDAGTAYDSFFVFGAVTLAQPGQFAPVIFVTTDCTATGSHPKPSVLFDELPTVSFGNLVVGSNPVPDPPQLPSSSTVFNDRWYINETETSQLCRWMFLRVDWSAENFGNELLTFTIFGTVFKE